MSRLHASVPTDDVQDINAMEWYVDQLGKDGEASVRVQETVLAKRADHRSPFIRLTRCNDAPSLIWGNVAWLGKEQRAEALTKIRSLLAVLYEGVKAVSVSMDIHDVFGALVARI